MGTKHADLLGRSTGGEERRADVNERFQKRFFEAMPRYEMRKVLGAGSMGVVYQAWDSVLETEIAIKVLRRLEQRESEGEDADRLARFKREMKLNRRLRHPGIARLYDYGEADGLPFVTMELVHGKDLREVMETESLPAPRSVRLLRQIAEACGAAHAAGIVHRDLKPENVMVQEDDQPVVLDLGLSVDVWRPSETPIGTILGTPLYMAPEEFESSRADARSDIYALGVIAFEMLAGRPPITGSSLVELAVTRRDTPADPAPLRGRSIPEPLVEIVMRCLERQPERRFETAVPLAAALGAFLLQPKPDLAATQEMPALRHGAVILTVDDDALIRKLLRLVLEPMGCEVLESESGESALRILMARPVDLVLLDIVMPVMDGFDVLQIIRSTPATARTPVVLVSARADRERRAFAMQKGANGFLEKPIDTDRVKQVVRNWLD